MQEVTSQGRPERVTANPLDAVALAGRDPHARMEIENGDATPAPTRDAAQACPRPKVAGVANFGTITTAGNPRVIQLAGKYLF